MGFICPDAVLPDLVELGVYMMLLLYKQQQQQQQQIPKFY